MRTRSLMNRRVAIGCLASLIWPSAVGAQMPPLQDDPPELRTARSQFIIVAGDGVLPPVGVERMDGKRIDLSSFRGRVVLLSFWATWCPPCRREIPQLEQLQVMLREEKIEIVAVSIDRSGTSVVKPFLDRLGVRKLTPYLDPGGQLTQAQGSDAGPLFRLYGMPISYIIDRHGRVAGYFSGEMDWTSPAALRLLRYYAAP